MRHPQLGSERQLGAHTNDAREERDLAHRCARRSLGVRRAIFPDAVANGQNPGRSRTLQLEVHSKPCDAALAHSKCPTGLLCVTLYRC